MALHHQMFEDLKNKSIFEQAQEYAFEYINTIFDRGVFPSVEALEQLSIFNETMPINGTLANEVLKQLHRHGSPATTATLGGRYFGFVTGSAVPIGIAAKQLASVWDQAPAMQVLSPIGSQLESIVERWIVELFGLPTETVAGFVSGTSSANLCALAAARYRIYQKQNWDITKKGLRKAPPIRIVTGKHAHSTVLKAISILGLGFGNIEWVEVDKQGRLNVDQLPPLDEHTILILQAGNVCSGAFDHFDQLCSIAQKAGSWVHIDGAFGLWAQTVDSLKYRTSGIENANSWAVDGHKTLNTPYDNGIILCKDSEALTSALHMSGSYIIQGQQRDGMYFTPEMSRRARVMELWAILKYLGKSGINEMIDTMHRRALQFAEELTIHPEFQIENEIAFNQVIVRCETDEMTESILLIIQGLGDCWLGGASWFGRKIMRMSICSWATTEQDITRTVQSFVKALHIYQSTKK